MQSAPEIYGHCDERFAPVRDVFQKNFGEGLELGASVAVVYEGEPVVDLWGGWADTERTRPWQEDSLVNVYSTTKVMAALCTLMLHDRGVLDVEEPVAKHWPEFAAQGKADIRIRHLLSHTSGIAGWEEPIDVETLCDWDRSVGMLAAQAPWWEPGTASVLACGGELDGVKLLSKPTLERAIQTESDGPDLVLGLPLRFGLGWGLTSPALPMGPGPSTFFWGGYGGSLVVMDPDSELAIAYAMNRMGHLVMGDVRGFLLAKAGFDSVAQIAPSGGLT